MGITLEEYRAKHPAVKTTQTTQATTPASSSSSVGLSGFTGLSGVSKEEEPKVENKNTKLEIAGEGLKQLLPSIGKGVTSSIDSIVDAPKTIRNTLAQKQAAKSPADVTKQWNARNAEKEYKTAAENHVLGKNVQNWEQKVDEAQAKIVEDNPNSKLAKGVNWGLELGESLGEMVPTIAASVAVGGIAGAAGGGAALASTAAKSGIKGVAKAAVSKIASAEGASQIAGLGAMFMNVYDKSVDDSVAQGYDYVSAGKKAFGDAALETATEVLFNGIGGLGKGVVARASEKAVAKNTAAAAASEGAQKLIKLQGVKNAGLSLANLVVDISEKAEEKNVKGLLLRAFGEGAEEMISEFFGPYIERATTNPNASNATINDMLLAGAGGALMSFAMAPLGGIHDKVASTSEEVQERARMQRMLSNVDEQIALARNFVNGEVLGDTRINAASSLLGVDVERSSKIESMGIGILQQDRRNLANQKIDEAEKTKTVDAVSGMWKELSGIYSEESQYRMDRVGADAYVKNTIEDVVGKMDTVLGLSKEIADANEELSTAKAALDEAKKTKQDIGEAKAAVTAAENRVKTAKHDYGVAKAKAKSQVTAELKRKDAVEKYGQEAVDNFTAYNRFLDASKGRAIVQAKDGSARVMTMDEYAKDQYGLSYESLSAKNKAAVDKAFEDYRESIAKEQDNFAKKLNESASKQANGLTIIFDDGNPISDIEKMRLTNAVYRNEDNAIVFSRDRVQTESAANYYLSHEMLHRLFADKAFSETDRVALEKDLDAMMEIVGFDRDKARTPIFSYYIPKYEEQGKRLADRKGLKGAKKEKYVQAYALNKANEELYAKFMEVSFGSENILRTIAHHDPNLAETMLLTAQGSTLADLYGTIYDYTRLTVLDKIAKAMASPVDAETNKAANEADAKAAEADIEKEFGAQETDNSEPTPENPEYSLSDVMTEAKGFSVGVNALEQARVDVESDLSAMEAAKREKTVQTKDEAQAAQIRQLFGNRVAETGAAKNEVNRGLVESEAYSDSVKREVERDLIELSLPNASSEESYSDELIGDPSYWSKMSDLVHVLENLPMMTDSGVKSSDVLSYLETGKVGWREFAKPRISSSSIDNSGVKEWLSQRGTVTQTDIDAFIQDRGLKPSAVSAEDKKYFSDRIKSMEYEKQAPDSAAPSLVLSGEYNTQEFYSAINGLLQSRTGLKNYINTLVRRSNNGDYKLSKAEYNLLKNYYAAATEAKNARTVSELLSAYNKAKEARDAVVAKGFNDKTAGQAKSYYATRVEYAEKELSRAKKSLEDISPSDTARYAKQKAAVDSAQKKFTSAQKSLDSAMSEKTTDIAGALKVPEAIVKYGKALEKAGLDTTWAGHEYEVNDVSYSDDIASGVNSQSENRKYPTSLAAVKYKFDQWNESPELSKLSEKVFRVANDLGIRVRSQDIVFGKPTVRGLSYSSYVQYMDSFFGSEDVKSQTKAEVALHELIHSCTTYAMTAVDPSYDNEVYARVARSRLNNSQKRAARTILNVYDKMKSSGKLDGLNYGGKSAYELIAEFSTTEIQDLLKKEGTRGRIVAAIRDILRLPVEGTYSEADRALNKLLDRPSLKAFHRFKMAQDSIIAQAGNPNGSDFFYIAEGTDENANPESAVLFGEKTGRAEETALEREQGRTGSYSSEESEGTREENGARENLDDLILRLGEYENVADSLFSEDLSGFNEMTEERLRQYEELAKKYGSYAGGVPKSLGGNNRVNKTAAGIIEDTDTPESFANYMKNGVLDGVFSGIVMTDANAKAYAQQRIGAHQTISQAYTDAVNNTFDNKHLVNKNDIAYGEQLIVDMAQRIRDIDNGDVKSNESRDTTELFNQLQDLIAKVCAAGTRAGQNLQAFSLLKKLTPTGRLYYINAQANAFVSEMTDRKGQSRIGGFRFKTDKGGKNYIKDINGNYVPFTVSAEIQEELMSATTQQELDEAENHAVEYLASLIPPNVEDRIVAWRYLAMLGNPRTHIRNMVSNYAMGVSVSIKDIIAGGMEDLFLGDKKEGRTKTLRSIPSEQRKAYEAFIEADWNNGMREQTMTGSKAGFQSKIEEKRRKLDWKFDNAAKKNTEFLELEDEKASLRAYKKAFIQYAVANDLSVEYLSSNTQNSNVALAQAHRYAATEAQKATYRDASTVATVLNQLEGKGTLSKIIVGGLMPFKKTPINILARGVEYSPIGVLKGAWNWYNASTSTNKIAIIDETGKQVTLTKDGYAKKKYDKSYNELDKAQKSEVDKRFLLEKYEGEFQPLNNEDALLDSKTDPVTGKKLENLADMRRTASEKQTLAVANAIDQLAAGLTGTGIMILGLLLSRLGMLKGAGDEDKTVEYYDQMLGNQEYSITIGNKNITLDWLTPVSMPLFTGASIYELFSDKAEFSDIVQSLTRLADPVTNLSVLQGINDAMSSYDSGLGQFAVSSIESFGAQFIPTAVGQLARTVDETRRTTYASKDAKGGKELATYINKLENKIPGLSQTNAAYVDQWGRQETNGGDNFISRLFHNSIAPWYTREKNITATDDYISTLHEQTGNDYVIPRSPESSYTFDNETFYLASDEYQTTKEMVGQISSVGVTSLMAVPGFSSLSADDQAELVSQAYSFAKNVAKADYAAAKGIAYDEPSSVQRLREAVNSGMSIGEALYVRFITGNMTADKDANGKTIKNSKKEKVYNFYVSMGLTKEQISAISTYDYE